jgi:N-acetylglucosamine malate deacetylase 1
MTDAGAILVVAAHPDDEILGCGGTMARLSRIGRPVHVVLLADGESSREPSPERLPPEFLAARNASATVACGILGCASVAVEGLADNRLDSLPLLDVVKLIETFIERIKPTTLFTHHPGDVNIDHRVVHEAVLAAARPQPGHCVRDLYFFEVPSSTEWRTPGSGPAFQPNCFVDIGDTLDLKLRALQAYPAELREFPHPRSLRAVEALARWRGATAGLAAAEAFVVGRRIL